MGAGVEEASRSAIALVVQAAPASVAPASAAREGRADRMVEAIAAANAGAVSGAAKPAARPIGS